MDANSNSLNWFEIPATDLKRAKKFYQAVFGLKKMEDMDLGNAVMAFFPWTAGNGKATGALVKSKQHKPSKTSGPLIYLNADPDLKKALAKVEKAGGKVLMPKTQVGEFGFMALFIDSEGNRMAMHSNK
jgi:predicted enzyme related to lactoylglutathione lyase